RPALGLPGRARRARDRDARRHPRPRCRRAHRRASAGAGKRTNPIPGFRRGSPEGRRRTRTGREPAPRAARAHEQAGGGSVNVLRLHLWKEWREHRLALLAVLATCMAMMTGAWIFRAPSLPMAWGVITVLVFLLAVGGELLGERRSGGLVWIQRLPSGLGTAFCAKLLFFLTTAVLVAVQGYGAGWLMECLRGRRSDGLQQDLELFVVVVAAIWGVWTFSVSAWALRGGLSL